MRGRRLLERTFGIDPRALAALRIGLAAILLGDLAVRARHLGAAYSDRGVLPRSLLDPWMRETLFPFHLLGGSVGFEALLFAAAAGFALMLALGWHTRVATAASWALLTSLQVRNPLVLLLGDDILRMVLFWSLFLPLGRCASLDARRAGGAARRAPVLSVAGAALLLQMAFVYWFTALLKSGPDWHADGTAVYYALQQDYWATGLGVALRGHLHLLELITRATLALEYAGPFLLLAPFWPLRTAGVAAFWLFHASLGATRELGPFPWIDIVALLPFLPSEVWNFISRCLGRASTPVPATPPPRSAALASLPSAAVAVLLLYVFAYNVHSVWPAVALPEPLVRAGRWLGINQEWRMFTPNAPREDGWLVVPGRLANGTRVDLSERGPALRWDKPPHLGATHESIRWAAYMWQLRNPATNAPLRRRFANWACGRWNRGHEGGERLVELEMVWMSERTPPPGGTASIERVTLLRHRCPDPHGRLGRTRRRH